MREVVLGTYSASMITHSSSWLLSELADGRGCVLAVSKGV